MNRPHFTPQTGVQETLEAAHGIDRVFNSHRTACVGCQLARFCTLDDVARAYRLDLEAFLAELEQAALADPTYLVGADYEKP